MLEQTKYNRLLSEFRSWFLAGIGILTALCYLVGRSYYQGYFDELGIDISLIQLSHFEYLEMGWFSLWETSLILNSMVLCLFFGFIVYKFIFAFVSKSTQESLGLIFLCAVLAILLRQTISSVWSTMSSELKGLLVTLLIVLFAVWMAYKDKFKLRLISFLKKLRPNVEYFDKIEDLIYFVENVLFNINYVLVFLFFAYLISSSEAKKTGIEDGMTFLKMKAYSVELTGSPISDYDNLRYLHYNNGNYFFSILDENTCKPLGIFVVHESNLLAIHFSGPLANSPCDKTN